MREQDFPHRPADGVYRAVMPDGSIMVAATKAWFIAAHRQALAWLNHQPLTHPVQQERQDIIADLRAIGELQV